MGPCLQCPGGRGPWDQGGAWDWRGRGRKVPAPQLGIRMAWGKSFPPAEVRILWLEVQLSSMGL
jgi:hypothetical protein